MHFGRKGTYFTIAIYHIASLITKKIRQVTIHLINLFLRRGVHQIASPIIIMVLHLAFTDLIVCCTNLPNYFIKHGGAVFQFKHAFSKLECDIMWYFTFFSIYNGWLAQGVIAVIRALSMMSERMANLFAKKWIFFFIIPGMYAFSALMAIPFFLEVSF